MSDLDRVLGELARLLRSISELPPEATEEREAIEIRRDTLTALAAGLQGSVAHRSPDPERL
ncbi:hypothetical protein HQ535_04135 [bacterium]|nr:hypothetical protein [bacterium]